MNYGKIMLFSGIALAVSLVMRLLQIIFTVDTSTGFFKTEYTAAGYYLMVMTAVICVTPSGPMNTEILIILPEKAIW